MFYKKYKPCKPYSKYIECYFIWEGFASTDQNIETPPSALSSIVFNYKEPYAVSNHRYAKQKAPEAFITGQAVRSYTLHLRGEIGMVGIVFKPAALYNFLGTPMYGLTEERIALRDLLDDQAQFYHDKIKSAFTHHDKLLHANDFVDHLMNEGPYGTPAIHFASNEIFESKGKIDISTLIKKAHMSRRQFERKFLEEVGVSPKAYAKIRRFGYACSLIQGKRKARLTDVLFDAGYYDQSHFIKDFKYFTGRSPKLYMETNTELANYLDNNFQL